MNPMQRELVIVGAGPAGLAAAIYGKRAMFQEVVLEAYPHCGGQVLYTDRIDNYPGLYAISGMELADAFRKHAEALHVPILEHTVVELKKHGDDFWLLLENGECIIARAVILAAGSTYRKLGVNGEKEFMGRGVSYCASCDGAFFKGKDTAVIGGGNTALQEALYFSSVCRMVYLLHRREEFRAEKRLQEELKKKENIKVLPYYEVKEIQGNKVVEELVLVQNQTGEEKKLPVSGVFVAIGMEARSQFARGIVKADKNGYLLAGEDCRTNIHGIYAAGYVRTKASRQIVTAVSDGAAAIHSLEEDGLL